MALVPLRRRSMGDAVGVMPFTVPLWPASRASGQHAGGYVDKAGNTNAVCRFGGRSRSARERRIDGALDLRRPAIAEALE
ncbi:MAG: hypothetical protein ACTHL6_02745, partial [Arthrobacter sp.]